tara:strand:+ start:244 stop:438 length:195 start_codon:yes stop_codon:yes gene_type:complete
MKTKAAQNVGSGEYLLLTSIAEIVSSMNVGDGAPPFTQAQLEVLCHLSVELEAARASAAATLNT